jgi:hypothetical protein
MALQPFGPWPLFQFLNLYAVSRILGREISPSQGRYLHRTTQRINVHRHYASRGIRTHDPSVEAGESGSCPRPRCHCDRQTTNSKENIINIQQGYEVNYTYLEKKHISCIRKMKLENYYATYSQFSMGSILSLFLHKFCRILYLDKAFECLQQKHILIYSCPPLKVTFLIYTR